MIEPIIGHLSGNCKGLGWAVDTQLYGVSVTWIVCLIT
jgi:hypothetical protein